MEINGNVLVNVSLFDHNPAVLMLGMLCALMASSVGTNSDEADLDLACDFDEGGIAYVVYAYYCWLRCWRGCGYGGSGWNSMGMGRIRGDSSILGHCTGDLWGRGCDNLLVYKTHCVDAEE